MTTSSRVSVANWLTQIPSAIDQQSALSPPSSPPSTSSSSAYVHSKGSRKRKRQADHIRSELGSNDSKIRATDQLHRRALVEIRGEMSSNRQQTVMQRPRYVKPNTDSLSYSQRELPPNTSYQRLMKTTSILPPILLPVPPSQKHLSRSYRRMSIILASHLPDMVCV